MKIEESTEIIFNDISSLLTEKKIIDLTPEFDEKNKAQATKIIKEFITKQSLYSEKTLDDYNIKLKIVSVNEKRKCHEAISFPYTSLYDIAFEKWNTDDEWVESQLKQWLKKTFIFIPVVKPKKASKFVDWNNWYISDLSIWKPSPSDLDEIGLEWRLAQKTIQNGVHLIKEPYGNSYRTKNNLLKHSETNYLHLRPHGKNSLDIDKKYLEYTQGNVEISKQSFWLNKSFINHLLAKNKWTPTSKEE